MERGFRGFLAEAGLTGGAGVARGLSCGESKRLISMILIKVSLVLRVVSKVESSDHKLRLPCTVESRGQWRVERKGRLEALLARGSEASDGRERS